MIERNESLETVLDCEDFLISYKTKNRAVID
jgi:hypothetical protein